MKEINLRDYYPFYTTDTLVEVPDEVADLLHEYKLNEAAYILRTYRHKAYFSLDYDANVERDVLIVQPSPFEILEQRRMTETLRKAETANLCALFFRYEQCCDCESRRLRDYFCAGQH